MSTGKHHGGCACGAISYSVEIDPEAQAITCNCSHCGRAGLLLQFVSPDKFTLEKGADNLAEYQFNKHVIHHVFCKTCGIKSFARGVGPGGKAMAAINVRCLEGVDPSKLEVKQFDGRSK